MRAYAWQNCTLIDIEFFGVANRHHFSLLNRRLIGVSLPLSHMYSVLMEERPRLVSINATSSFVCIISILLHSQ